MSQEKVALVTGVSSGIGRAIVGLLSHHGFRVFGTARGNGGTKRALENVELVHVDVRNEKSVDSFPLSALLFIPGLSGLQTGSVLPRKGAEGRPTGSTQAPGI